MNVEENDIKQFSEFTEVAPSATQNLITDVGRFTVGALYDAVVNYATPLIGAATSEAVNGVETLINAAAADATQESESNAELALSYKLAAETAANGAVQLVGLEELRRRAKNIGKLYCSGGTATTGNSLGLPSTFSLLFFCENITVPTTEISTILNTNVGAIANSAGIALQSILTVGYWRLRCRDTDGNYLDYRYYSTFFTSVKSIGIICNGTAPTLLVNGNVATPYWQSGSCDFTKLGAGKLQLGSATFSGAISRVSLFNFDVSADDALFTIDDFLNSKPISPTLNGVLLNLDDSASGAQIRDLSTAKNNVVLTGSVLSDKNQNPCCERFKFTFASGAGTTSGQYMLGSSDAKSLPANTQASILLRSDSALSVNIGGDTATDVSKYASAVALSANVWTRIELSNDSSSADGLTISPAATLGAAANIDCIVELRENF